MLVYNKENLHRCVRNLFEKARHELKEVRDFGDVHNNEIKKNLPFKDLVISRWEESEEPFSATGLKIWRIEDSRIIVEFAVYDSGVKATAVVGDLKHPEEIYAWLDDPESLDLCIEWSDHLLKDVSFY